jgi:hypothetical protein
MSDDELSAAVDSCEIWADVEGFIGAYEVSSHGRVRSLRRTIPVRSSQQQRVVPPKILRPQVRPCDGREKFTLSRRGVRYTRTISQLMQQAGFTPTKGKDR